MESTNDDMMRVLACCRLVYVVCADDDGRFQSPPAVDGSVEAAVRRLRVAGQLLQVSCDWSRARCSSLIGPVRHGGAALGTRPRQENLQVNRGRRLRCDILNFLLTTDTV